MRTALPAAMAGLLLFGCAAPPPAPVPDLSALMREVSGAPYRYGGDLSGTVPGLAAAAPRGVRAPVHVALGLGAPDRNGVLHGRAVLFGAGRRFLGQGTVSGRIDPGFSAGTASCRLRIDLPTGPVLLDGICTADALSGEIVAQPPPPGLLTRVAAWWDDRAVSGRYWLDRDSFDPPARETGPAQRS